MIHPAPTIEERELLMQLTKMNGPPPFIDLALGTLVSCVQNLGTQIGTHTIMKYKNQQYYHS